MSGTRGLLAALLAVATLVIAGCGDSSSDAEPKHRAPETADKPPEVPAGWKAHVNTTGGFVLALPPGWSAKEIGASSLISSLDKLVSIQLTPDRTNEAINFDPGEFATRAIEAVPGYEHPLKPGQPQPYPHRYEGTSVKAHGVAKKSGVEQDVELIFLVRPKVAAFTAIVAANADPASAGARALATDVLDTLRSRPPG